MSAIMEIAQIALAGTGIVVVVVGAAAIIPNPFRDTVRDALSVWFGRGSKLGTSEIERAEARVRALEAQIKEDNRKVSDLRGSLNHAKNVLTDRKSDLKKAEADYELAREQKLGEQAEQDCLDAIGAAEEAMRAQESVVEDFQKSVDVTRLAVAKAASEVKKLALKVQSKAAKDAATRVMNSASKVLEDTKDIAKATSDIGKDLDAIDEKYEQAKARLEDAQGSETERKLEEARKNKERDEIRKRMEERKNAEKSGK